MSDVAKLSTRAGGVLAATCILTLVVNAITSSVGVPQGWLGPDGR